MEQVLDEDLPTLLGALVEAEERARLRLRNIVPNHHATEPEPDPARLLTPEETIAVIGGVSRKWLLRRTKGLRFRSGSRKVIRFEQAGLLRWWAARH